MNEDEVEDAEEERKDPVVLAQEDLPAEQVLLEEAKPDAEKAEKNSADGHENSG